MDEETLPPNAAYAKLEDNLERLLGVLAEYVGPRAALERR